MNEITPSELILFKRYLSELREAPTDYLEKMNFRDRWKGFRKKLTDISERMDEVVSAEDKMVAEE